MAVPGDYEDTQENEGSSTPATSAAALLQSLASQGATLPPSLVPALANQQGSLGTSLSSPGGSLG